MLYHPGSNPRRPIAPITLLTLTASPANLHNPETEIGKQQTLFTSTGEQGFANIIGSESNLDPVACQPSTAEQQDQSADLVSAQPDPMEVSDDLEANPSTATAAQQADASTAEQGMGANPETLTLLIWVHPAAAREAWETLSACANQQGVRCVSRYSKVLFCQ